MPAPDQQWLTQFLLPAVSLIAIFLCAHAIRRERWFHIRPLLSFYVWFLAATSLGLLLMSYATTVCSGTIQYALCRVYIAAGQVIEILASLITVAVVYEFLFRAAGEDGKIRHTAVTGFAVTIAVIIIGALLLIAPRANALLEDSSRLVFGMTGLALLPSGIFILVVKRVRSLFMSVRLTVLFIALVLYDFIYMLGSFALRRDPKIQNLVVELTWIALVAVLYWALSKGPELPA